MALRELTVVFEYFKLFRVFVVIFVIWRLNLYSRATVLGKLRLLMFEIRLVNYTQNERRLKTTLKTSENHKPHSKRLKIINYTQNELRLKLHSKRVKIENYTQNVLLVVA